MSLIPVVILRCPHCFSPVFRLAQPGDGNSRAYCCECEAHVLPSEPREGVSVETRDPGQAFADARGEAA